MPKFAAEIYLKDCYYFEPFFPLFIKIYYFIEHLNEVLLIISYNLKISFKRAFKSYFDIICQQFKSLLFIAFETINHSQFLHLSNLSAY